MKHVVSKIQILKHPQVSNLTWNTSTKPVQTSIKLPEITKIPNLARNISPQLIRRYYQSLEGGDVEEGRGNKASEAVVVEVDGSQPRHAGEVLRHAAMEIVVAEVQRNQERQISQEGGDGGREPHVGDIQCSHSAGKRAAADSDPVADGGGGGPVLGYQVMRVCGE